MTMEQCDVAVIGGGPAGSTAAALLARRGYKVIALEKAHHPRFHIGESLLPMNLPIFERLGVLDKVRALGVFKPGADFEADNERGYNTYAFARAIGNSPPHAYQVWRQDFDKMLYDHARSCGAEAREGHEVVKVEQKGPRETRLEVDTDDGRSYGIQARYIVDASGRDALLSARKGLRRRNPEHQSAAIFGHFRGAEPRAGEDAGNISIYRFDHGWMWMIPLPDGVMSVGAVCRPDYLKQRKGRTVEFLIETLKLSPALWKRMESAQLIGGDVRVTGNYSYDSARMGGPGWVLVGDAFAFLDPVFSSGVYLAMSGAEQAVDVVDSALREPETENVLLRKLEKTPACRHGPLLLLHLSLQRTGDAADVPRTPQHLAIGTGRHFHARRRFVRHSPGAVAPEAVQSSLCHRRPARLAAVARRAQVPPGAGALAVHRRQYAAGQVRTGRPDIP